MSIVETLTKRNEAFVAHRFRAGLPLMPTLGTIIVGCVDPRVDPAHVLGLEPGEAVVIRNVGGRITPATLQTISLLGLIPRVDGAGPEGGLNLVVLHHTDCGISRLARFRDQLAGYFGVPTDDLDAKAVADPMAAVEVDVGLLKTVASLPRNLIVSGFVYDVATGHLDPVVPPAPLRGEGQPA
jgi:carbonic anhydrase